MARQDEPRDEMRIGDTERDAVMVALHDHFAAGRLDRGELDERMDAVLSAKTRGDLRPLVRDLPAPTGLPEPDRRAPSSMEGAAVMFGGPWHPAWQEHHRHMARRRHRHMARGHHRHGPPFPAFPLLLAVFLVLAFTVGPGAGVLAVLQIALAVWIVRAALLAFGARKSGRST
ncbi:DUF1707 SHOCT-like domain-containing protein [Actinomadura livida]|uniref:DUF1707 domain-containing protein n=1 Tax=Actinomadura livida TaxID=79909 RepID=A0A7W7IBT6_9ACTN|nr:MULTISPECIES: DUF1707 domain-containing protein [Actinomadura]MBB4774163.1 hypothetical protein [Actinomadura catellatispora]GGT84425.1 hypothetical protein GCM10010208_03940 [Actinomadura livida]